jgi:adenine-specific DNA-methyltransferase
VYTEASGRFHTDWLNMMYPRLKLARNLLTTDGAIAISLDDNEITNCKALLDEVFGGENFIAQIVVESDARVRHYESISTTHEYLIIYAKNEEFEFSALREENKEFQFTDELGGFDIYELRNRNVEFNISNRPNLYYPFWVNPDNPDTNGFHEVDIVSRSGWVETYPQESQGIKTVWRWGKEKAKQNLKSNLVARRHSAGAFQVIKKYRADTTAYSTVWTENDIKTDKGTLAIKDTFDGKKIFNYAKPPGLIQKLFDVFLDEGAIVLDFFAGSGTTGYAAYRHKLGAIRHVLVQLPEPLDIANKEQKMAADFCDKLGKPRTIAELTKERLRRAGKKIKAENPLFAGDLGFRVFKLASSNIRAWEPDRDKLAETLEASIEHLKTDRTEQDILFELLLKLGLDLCVPIETRIFYHEKHEAHEKGGDQKVEAMMSLHPQDFRAFRVFRGSPAESPEGSHTVHSIGGGSLLVCLSKFIPQADVEPLALGLVAWHKELKPAGETTVVFRDSAFADDVAKTNLTAILHQHGLETVRSL